MFLSRGEEKGLIVKDPLVNDNKHLLAIAHVNQLSNFVTLIFVTV